MKETHAELQRRLRAEAKKNGMCSNCRARPRHNELKQCLVCAEKGRLRAQVYYRAAGIEPTAACSTCKQLGIESTGHNQRSHDRWMAAREGWTK